MHNSMHHTMAVNLQVGSGRFLMVDMYGKIMTYFRGLLTEGREWLIQTDDFYAYIHWWYVVVLWAVDAELMW